MTTARVEASENLAVVRLPDSSPGARVVLETVVAQELVAALSDERNVPIESIVFINDDTKEGGIVLADFVRAAPVAVS